MINSEAIAEINQVERAMILLSFFNPTVSAIALKRYCGQCPPYFYLQAKEKMYSKIDLDTNK